MCLERRVARLLTCPNLLAVGRRDLAIRVSTAGGPDVGATRSDKVNATCEGTGRFTLAAAGLRPLERLCQLRGADAALRELAEGNLELRDFLARLHNLYREEAKQWAKTQIDGIVLGDDMTWAASSQTNLDLWRSLILPLFRDFLRNLRAGQIRVFSGSRPECDVLDDMIEVGIDAVHAQWHLDDYDYWRSLGADELFFGAAWKTSGSSPSTTGRRSRGRLSRSQGRRFRLRRNHQPNYVECNVPPRNVVAYFEQWLVPLPVAV